LVEGSAFALFFFAEADLCEAFFHAFAHFAGVEEGLRGWEGGEGGREGW
jgi:hypothetical protein